MIFWYTWRITKKVDDNDNVLVTALRNGLLLQYNTVKLESNPTNYLP